MVAGPVSPRESGRLVASDLRRYWNPELIEYWYCSCCLKYLFLIFHWPFARLLLIRKISNYICFKVLNVVLLLTTNPYVEVVAGAWPFRPVVFTANVTQATQERIAKKVSIILSCFGWFQECGVHFQTSMTANWIHVKTVGHAWTKSNLFSVCVLKDGKEKCVK